MNEVRGKFSRLLDGVFAVRTVPVAAFVVLPVLAVRLKWVMVSSDAAHLWEEFYVGDIRSWWKAVFVVGVAAWMLAQTCVFAARGWRPRQARFFLLLITAAVVTVFSTLLSGFPLTKWIGYTAQYEGCIVLLAYLAGAWYVCETCDAANDRLWILRVIGFLGLVNSALGISKGLGWDFWQSPVGYWIIGGTPQTVRHNFGASGMASGTLFQPNHFGMFMAMLAALSVGMLFLEKKRKWLLFWTVNALLAVMSVVFSHSRAAVITLTFTLACGGALAALYRRNGCGVSLAANLAGAFQKRKAAFFVTAFLVVLLAVGGVFGKLWQALSDMAGRSTARRAAVASPLKGADVRDQRILLLLEGMHLHLQKGRDGDWRASKGGGDGSTLSRLAASPESAADGWTRLVLPDFPKLVFRYHANGRARLAFHDITLDFFTIGSDILVMDGKRLYRSVAPSRGVDIGGYEGLFSGRGYIWSRALALVPDSPWFGSGPGTFALVFPNDDMVGKQRYLEGGNEDKGHGIWIHFLVQLGVVGLLAYLLPVLYVVAALRRQFSLQAMPYALGIAAYLVGSITNDSTVGVTPVFCVLCGLAVAACDGRAVAAD